MFYCVQEKKCLSAENRSKQGEDEEASGSDEEKAVPKSKLRNSRYNLNFI